jgi:hypothetical protein
MNGASLIDDANLVAWFLDRISSFPTGQAANAEPLLINRRIVAVPARRRWNWRISSWPRTTYAYTDIACMEAANKQRDRPSIASCWQPIQRSCRTYGLGGATVLQTAWEIDRIRFALGPHRLAASEDRLRGAVKKIVEQ